LNDSKQKNNVNKVDIVEKPQNTVNFSLPKNKGFYTTVPKWFTKMYHHRGKSGLGKA